MVELPYRLASRPSLVAKDVGDQFAPLVAEINGNLGAAHFSRRARIPNALKAAPLSVLAVQAKVKNVASPSYGMKLTCLCPKRTGATAWELFAVTYHYQKNIYPGHTANGPITGTLYYGGTGRDQSQPLDAEPANKVLLRVDGSYGDADGNMFAELDLDSGDGGLLHYLIAWYRARHTR